jgi:phytol kinase
MFANNVLALAATFILALSWLRIVDFIAHRGWISGRVSRKIIHAGTGPIFVLCWLFFHETPSARYLAALVPFAITLQFALVGMGPLRDRQRAAMSRTGDRRKSCGPRCFMVVLFF